MESLLQQECLTESQIETYKGQLELVEGQLDTGINGPDAADLKQLKDNLTQLISLTEDTLLDLKKQRLLLSLQAADAPDHENRGGLEKKDEGKEDRGEDEDSDKDYQGIKCQAPMQEPWGAINYHNAVILCREEDSTGQENQGQENVMVRVLFTQPTSKAMKACPFYLDGKCRFDGSGCNYSHGHVVRLSELLTYQEPDYNLACIGGKCMAKHTDDLWYPAIISSFDEEFTVHFPSLNTTVRTAIQNVFPLEGSSESGDSSDSSESGDDELEVEDVVIEWTPRGAQRALGDWEKYTTGIGSKLLAKMGYIVGQGLGRSGEGRVEPVEIKILPAGKSLDVCAEMRENGKVRKAPGSSQGEEEGKRQRKRRKRRLLETTGLEKERKVDIFEFLNTKLRKDKPVEEETRATTSRHKSGNINVQLFTVQEDIKVVMKRRQSLMTQLARHKGRDKTMEAHVMEKISSVDKEIEKLQTVEKKIEKTLAMKSERKKLRIF